MNQDKNLTRLLRLTADMAGIIYRYQHLMKPREADKARQAKCLIKKWNRQKHAANAPTTCQTSANTPEEAADT